jgi:hypothetical protein
LPEWVVSGVSHGRRQASSLPASHVVAAAESVTSPGVGPVLAVVVRKFWDRFPETGFSVTPERLSSMRADTSACTGAMRKIL